MSYPRAASTRIRESIVVVGFVVTPPRPSAKASEVTTGQDLKQAKAGGVCGTAAKIQSAEPGDMGCVADAGEPKSVVQAANGGRIGEEGSVRCVYITIMRGSPCHKSKQLHLSRQIRKREDGLVDFLA